MLGDNTGGGRSSCGSSGSTGLEFGYKPDSLLHTHIFDHMRRQFRLPRKWGLFAGKPQ